MNIPFMKGVQTVQWLQEYYPSIHPVALSMNDSDKKFISMIKVGCRAYLHKDVRPA